MLCAAAFLVIAARTGPTWAAEKDYLGRVRAYVDTMIEHGRDTVGKTESPLFLISIDPETMTLPNIRRPRGLAVARLPELSLEEG
jgi:hypothetical protein